MAAERNMTSVFCITVKRPKACCHYRHLSVALMAAERMTTGITAGCFEACCHYRHFSLALMAA